MVVINMVIVMNIKLNKKKIKTLSADKKVIPQEQTNGIGGGGTISLFSICINYTRDCATVSH
ncbi:hypothetical protein N476_24095 [Pseudoalteromonas luteoviolacea H33]|uniref:Uncharacterized protein n=1 Tax=Pseudoalteromonas luteoviolacea H33 TaxID=1365251 RepID=A0A167BK54_9GAMM|nr:hypothetical protein N476_24095 [Pseudoalteromonas luteoviolacea H33]KZN76826.1 hypothetical protein N477_01390 [Pseudoalteromonas luteoviolacea H33-S]